MRYSLSSSILVFISAALTACAQTELPPGVVALRDLEYVGEGNPRQQLDLYLPEKPAAKPLPLIVYVHGGGWESGAKSDTSLLFQLMKKGGYAGASLGYRLTQEAAWPAQIHDVKAALRWLSANAGKHGIDPERIGVSGISAGGHLVSLLGTRQGVKELSGSDGASVADAKIACVLNFCGPANFLGFEQRNVNWQKARGRWDVSTGLKNKTDMEALQAFFRARFGKAHGFRFKDWSDYQAVAQNLGAGNGRQTTFQLLKLYSSGGYSYSLEIKKPVSGTVKIYLNSILQASGFTIDSTTGIVTFSAAPGAGVNISADFDFDVPVRFDTDALAVRADGPGYFRVGYYSHCGDSCMRTASSNLTARLAGEVTSPCHLLETHAGGWPGDGGQHSSLYVRPAN